MRFKLVEEEVISLYRSRIQHQNPSQPAFALIVRRLSSSPSLTPPEELIGHRDRSASTSLSSARPRSLIDYCYTSLVSSRALPFLFFSPHWSCPLDSKTADICSLDCSLNGRRRLAREAHRRPPNIHRERRRDSSQTEEKSASASASACVLNKTL